MVCDFWKELDDENAQCYEYCRAEGKRTNCCGDKAQCLYPVHLYREDDPKREEGE